MAKVAKVAKWRRHTEEFKRQVVERMKTCQNIHELAKELKIQRKLLYTWRYQFEGRPEPRRADLATTAEERKEKHLQDEIVRLKQALADKTLENDFFKAALLNVEEARQASTKLGGPASTPRSGRGRKSKATKD